MVWLVVCVVVVVLVGPALESVTVAVVCDAAEEVVRCVAVVVVVVVVITAVGVVNVCVSFPLSEKSPYRLPWSCWSSFCDLWYVSLR